MTENGKAEKVYHMNKEIRSKADTAGVPVSESYSLRQDGNIVRYLLRLRAAGGKTPIKNCPTFYYTGPGAESSEHKNEFTEDTWIKDNNWADDSSSI